MILPNTYVCPVKSDEIPAFIYETNINQNIFH
jgi:hypothetical protein